MDGKSWPRRRWQAHLSVSQARGGARIASSSASRSTSARIAASGRCISSNGSGLCISSRSRRIANAWRKISNTRNGSSLARIVCGCSIRLRSARTRGKRQDPYGADELRGLLGRRRGRYPAEAARRCSIAATSTLSSSIARAMSSLRCAAARSSSSVAGRASSSSRNRAARRSSAAGDGRRRLPAEPRREAAARDERRLYSELGLKRLDRSAFGLECRRFCASTRRLL
jgi:hypothetical protein